MPKFNPTHVLSVPGDASVLIECVPQDGTETWHKLYLESEAEDALFIRGADGKIRNSYTDEVIEGATITRIR